MVCQTSNIAPSVAKHHPYCTTQSVEARTVVSGASFGPKERFGDIYIPLTGSKIIQIMF